MLLEITVFYKTHQCVLQNTPMCVTKHTKVCYKTHQGVLHNTPFHKANLKVSQNLDKQKTHLQVCFFAHPKVCLTHLKVCFLTHLKV